MNASLTIEKFTLYKSQPTCIFSIYKLYLVNFCVVYLSSLNGPRMIQCLTTLCMLSETKYIAKVRRGFGLYLYSSNK